MTRFLPLPNLSRIAIRPRFLIALMLSVLIAFAVVIAMAGLLPPGAARPVRIDAIAAALRGTGDETLLRTVSVGAPAAGDRWLEAPSARRQIAAILRVPAEDVRMLIAAPMQTRPASARTALAGVVPIRAGFLPFAQDGAAPTSAAPPVTVVAPPPPVVVTPAPRPAAPATPTVRQTPAPVDRPRATSERPANRPAETQRPRSEQRRAPEATPATNPAPSPAAETGAPAVTGPAEADSVVPAPVATPVVAPVASPAPVAKPAAADAVQEISGDFRAALRLPGGGWAIVRPLPEPFPSTTQQRMILWFLVALALTLPIAWGLALMLARPLMRFADAAERSGREPGYVMPSVGIPAELVPALAALTRLQMRAQRLEGDRSAFAGTLRNELRAPLERLRAGLDDAPRQIREAFHDDLTDIEEAVAALQLFLNDAGSPTLLRRIDLGEMVRAAAATASEAGEPVTADASIVAPVEADPDAIARLFDHLIAYGRRQGGAVLLQLAVEADGATVAVTDSGRPEPAAFAPGLHGKAERAGTVRPSGPGLAVARSIARAHGGEVLLVRSDQGMAVKLRLPVAGR